ncbi:hypothetical protein LCGC14_1273830 [marine sediment metagenome]|uniref:Uncharacterized protein n=1 Tax=marine sediment metagenome TaxID=412755 RepID=A0A0F9NE02_9ZZZZ
MPLKSLDQTNKRQNMFNKYQKDHMDYLDSLDPEKRCWCGWFLFGECYHDCSKNKTFADKLKVRCNLCGNAPWRPGGKLIHIKGCPKEDVKLEKKT